MVKSFEVHIFFVTLQPKYTKYKYGKKEKTITSTREYHDRSRGSRRKVNHTR